MAKVITVEELVYSKILDEQTKILEKRGESYIFDISDARHKLRDMDNEDFLKLISEAIELRLEPLYDKIVWK